MTRFPLTLIALISLAACGPIDIGNGDGDDLDECDVCGDDSDDGGGMTDADNDGYANTVDCNDNDADVHPGAEEVEDGIDNDCDGFIDEGFGGTDAIDADGDGYANTVDCDDYDSDVHPGADEVCDDIDNDCDGYIDEGDDCNGSDGDQMELYIGTPGGAEVGTMFVHVEFLTDLDVGYGTWTWSGRYAWSTGVELGFNPGLIEGARWNATYCTTDTTNEADASCTNWLAYGSTSATAHLTASTSVVYFDQSYSVDTVTFSWYEGTTLVSGSSAVSEF